MPTALSHAAAPVAIGLGLGPAISHRLLAAAALASALPDADVIGFRLGIPYGAELGHRGLTHSLAFAATCAAVAAGAHRALRARALTAFAYVFLATASHGVLDAFTTGGLGVAFLWPFSGVRSFAPARFIRVAPIGFAPLLSRRGYAVVRSELLWLWVPSALLGLALARTRPPTRASSREEHP